MYTPASTIFHAINDPFDKSLLEAYAKKFPGTKYQFTAGSAATGMYRGIKFYEAAVKETKGDLHREAVAAAMDHGVIDRGPRRRFRHGARPLALQNEHVHRNLQGQRRKTRL